MKYLIIFILIAAASCSKSGSRQIITTGSLLDEMADLGRLTRLPVAKYKTIQYSSYDRRSTRPTDSCWFSNEDGFGGEPVPAFEKVLEQPDSKGIGRYLICDVGHPGAIVRLWTAGINGKISLFLDGIKTPVFEGNAEDFFWKTINVLSGGEEKPEYDNMFRQFDATYFPVPFSRRCRIEWTGDISKIHFYHVGLRVYDQNVIVETYRPEDFKKYAGKLEEIKDALSNKFISPADNKADIRHEEVPAGSGKVLYMATGQYEISSFTIKLKAADYENALRKCVLRIFFDDSSVPQVEAPLGDFFGSAPGLNVYESLPFSVQPDSSMICRFIMPFKRSLRIEVENNSAENISIKSAVSLHESKWVEGKTMHFRARWTIDHGLTASYFDPKNNEVQDIIYLMASGQGRVVGASAFIYNPSSATTSWGNWWGEGDEKIFVDQDTFPSFYGTGSEDYFNYSWSSSKIFSYPYCGQPRNDGPGNRGYVSDFRWHISDDIFFRDKISFSMELGHHGKVPGLSYGRIVYFYALPATIDNYRRIAPADIAGISYPTWTPLAYLGSAGYRFIQAEDLISSGPTVKVEKENLCAGEKMVNWKPEKAGEKIGFKLRLDKAQAKTNIGMTLFHNPKGGKFSVSINGKPVSFDGNAMINLFEPFQNTLVNHFSEPVDLNAGNNEVVFESGETGKNKGIDFIWMKTPAL